MKTYIVFGSVYLQLVFVKENVIISSVSIYDDAGDEVKAVLDEFQPTVVNEKEFINHPAYHDLLFRNNHFTWYDLTELPKQSSPK